MENSKLSDSLKDKIKKLHSYSACDVSDALLKLQKTRPEEAARAGFLADISLYPPRSDAVKVIAPASTLKLVPKGSGIPVPSDAEAGAVPKSCHWVDVTDPGTVLVVEQPEGQKCAAVGGIMALRMHVRGVLGCVVGGRVRDMVEFAKIGLPVWAYGPSTVGASAETKVYAQNVDIRIGGVPLSPTDIVVCDSLEGVVVIPNQLLDGVLDLIPQLVAADDKVKADVQRGMSVFDAFKKHRG